MQQDSTPLIPMNITAEKKVCGSLLISPHEISDLMLRLSPNEFYSQHYRFMYEAMCSLFIDGNPVTTETVANVLRSKKEVGVTRLDAIGGTQFILDTLEGIGPEEIDFWTDEVKKKHDQRQMLEFAQAIIAGVAKNPEDMEAFRNKTEEKLVRLGGTSSSTSVSLSTAVDDLGPLIQRYISNPDGIIGRQTKLDRLDKALDGLKPGNVTIVYAPSSRFKSLFTTNIGWRLAEQNIPGLWFTTEMPRIQVMERILQLESGLNFKWLRYDKRMAEYENDIKAAQKRLKSLPIYFCDNSEIDVATVRSEVARFKRWHDIEYIIIDLVDHVSSSRYKDEMVNNQRAVMASMKAIAKDYNVHIILVSHVSKGARGDRLQADLDVEEMIGSAAKYQDVDASISIAPVTTDDEGKLRAMAREEIIFYLEKRFLIPVMISVTKNRHGELLRYIVDLNFSRGGVFNER